MNLAWISNPIFQNRSEHRACVNIGSEKQNNGRLNPGASIPHKREQLWSTRSSTKPRRLAAVIPKQQRVLSCGVWVACGLLLLLYQEPVVMQTIFRD